MSGQSSQLTGHLVRGGGIGSVKQFVSFSLALAIVVGGCVTGAPSSPLAPSPSAASVGPTADVLPTASSTATDNANQSTGLLARSNSGAAIILGAARSFAILPGGGTIEFGPTLTGRPRSEAIAIASPSLLALAVALDPATVAVYRSMDDGSTWTSPTTVAFEATPGIRAIDLASAGDSLAILATDDSNANVSSGEIAVAGTDFSWKTAVAPAGGGIRSALGKFWIVGGPRLDEVYTSSSALTWTKVNLPIKGSLWSALPPVEVAGIGAVIAVIAHEPEHSLVTFYGSATGTSWTPLNTFAAPATEQSTTIPISILPGGQWMAVSPDASKVFSGTVGAAVAEVSPNGLPIGTDDVVLVSPTVAVAATSSGRCASGKQACTVSTDLVRTTDGGQTWVPAG